MIKLKYECRLKVVKTHLNKADFTILPNKKNIIYYKIEEIP